MVWYKSRGGAATADEVIMYADFGGDQSVTAGTFTVARPELKEWIGNRAEAGRLPPKGFPKNNRFEG